MQHVYAMVNSRIQHIKKRFQVFDFFEKLRVSIFKNHNSLVMSMTQDVLDAVGRAKHLIIEFDGYFEKLNEIILEVDPGSTSWRAASLTTKPTTRV